MFRDYYEGAVCSDRAYGEGEVSSSFSVATGVRQGYILSPLMFNNVIDRIMSRATTTSFYVGKDLSVEDLD